MRIRNLLIAAAVLSLAIPGFANAGAANDRATGGGQILLSSDGKGAGDTIAFTAQNTGGANDAAKGEVQYIDRTGGTGRGATRFHGDVKCLIVQGNTAELAGTFKNGTGETTGFILYAADNGEGLAADPDQILFTRTSDPVCDRDDSDDDGQTDLARGNAQVYDAP